MAHTNVTLAIPVVDSRVLSQGGYLRFYTVRPAKTTVDRRVLVVNPASFVSLLPNRNSGLPEIAIPKMSRSQSERAARIVNGVCATLVSLWPAGQFGLTPNYGNIEAMRALMRLVSWTLSTFVGCGEKAIAKSLKGMAAWSRYLAGNQVYEEPPMIHRFPFSDSEGRFQPSLLFKGSIRAKATSQTCLLRLSRMSRALPPGSSADLLAAEKEHQRLSLMEPVVEPSITRCFREVAAKVSKGRLNGISRAVMDLSASASLESNRKKGGAMSYLRERLWHFYPDTWCRIEDPTPFVPGGGRTPTSEFQRLAQPITGLPWEIEYVRDRFQSVLVYECNDGFGDLGDTFLRASAPWESGYPDDEDHPYYGHPRRPVHIVTAVPDRGGFKTRVVTAGPAAFNCLAQTVRRVTYPRILMQIPTKWGLIQDGVLKFYEQLPLEVVTDSDLGYLGEWVLMSSDLSSATDRFPHCVVESINDGLESSLSDEDRRCPAWSAWRSLSGPQVLHYGPRKDHITPPFDMEGSKDSKCPGCVTTKCGNLMGTVPSWTHLNLYNLTAIRLAWSLWMRKGFREAACRLNDLMTIRRRGHYNDTWAGLKALVLKWIERSDHHSFRFPEKLNFNRLHCLVGDDLGALIPWGVAVIYEMIIELTNGKLSPGKHYVQPATEGGYILIAEEFAVIHGNTLKHLPIEHLRGVAQAVSAHDGRGDTPQWATAGSVLTSCVPEPGITNYENTLRHQALLSFAHIALSDLRRKLQMFGLPIYLPTSVGGMGWPHPKGITEGVNRTPIRALLHYHVLRGFRSDPVRFSCEVAKTRALWSTVKERNHMGPIMDSLHGYLKNIPVSRDEFGRLAIVNDSAPIGLRDPERPDGEQVQLSALLQRLAAAGIAVRYLVAEPFEHFYRDNAAWFDELVTSTGGDVEIIDYHILPVLGEIIKHLKDDMTIRQAARLYRRRTTQLLNLRAGAGIRIVPRTNYERLFKEDEEMVKSLYVLKTEQLISQYPGIFDPAGRLAVYQPPQAEFHE